jgi:hypothetical protein
MKYKKAGFIKFLFTAVLVFNVFIFYAEASARPDKPENGFEFGTWRNYLGGTLGFANTGYDLKGDFKKNADFPFKTVALFGYTYKLGSRSDICLRANVTKNTGSFKAAAANNVLINNVVFGAGGVSNISADMRFSDYELLASRELGATDRNGFVDLVYGAKFIRLSLDLKDRDFKMENHYLRQFVVPVTGVHAQCRIDDKWRGYTWFYAGTAKADGGAAEKNYKTIDLDAGVEYHFTPREPDYVEIGPGRPEAPAVPMWGKVDWYVKLAYKERYFKETAGANVIRIGHSGPEVKFAARF